MEEILMLHSRWGAEEVFVTDFNEFTFFKDNKDKYYAFIVGDSAFVPLLSYKKGLKEMNGE